MTGSTELILTDPKYVYKRLPINLTHYLRPIENNVFSRFKNKKITIVHILLQVKSRNRHTFFFLAVFEFLKIIIGLPIRIFFQV